MAPTLHAEKTKTEETAATQELRGSYNRQINPSVIGTTLTAFFLFLFLAAPVAYGSSQARGQIRAAAAGLHHSHSNTRSKP